ncbi:MAG: hypothetical protein IPK14_08850 [Blastocatellia bacterium]|nr:hypothetical protein [Blastocatellia bacterium]
MLVKERNNLPKQVPGSRYIRYRNYLPELARKPQAVRQVAPNLVTELGEPFPQLWEMLSSVYGGREAGRVLSRILGAVLEHGEEEVKRSTKKIFGSKVNRSTSIS